MSVSFVSTTKVRMPRSMAIMVDVCKDRMVKVSEVLGGGKSDRVVKARWEVIRRLRTEMNLSTTQIGRIIRKDHSTVVHALQQINDKGGLAFEIGNVERIDIECMVGCETSMTVAISTGQMINIHTGRQRMKLHYLLRDEIVIIIKYGQTPWRRPRDGEIFRPATVQMPLWIAKEKGLI